MIPDAKTIIIVGGATLAFLAYYRLTTGSLYAR